jgi:putative nucleotide binding protein
MKEFKKDEWAIVLDFLPHGLYGMERSQPIAQVLGERYFSLLNVVIRGDLTPKIGDRLYIGDDKRNEVKYIIGRIEVKSLTNVAREELEPLIKEIIDKKPQPFFDFFNKTGQITTRLHQLELLPGIGKKHLWAILDERKVKPFESFEDIKKRVPLMPDPEKMIIKRIMGELEDVDKYRVFVPKFEKGKFE